MSASISKRLITVLWVKIYLHSISEVLNISMEDPLIAAWAAAYGQLADLFITTEKAIYNQHQQTKGSWLGLA